MARAIYSLFAICFAGLLPAATLSIFYETRPYAGGSLATAADYQANWAALVAANPTPPAGFGAASVPAWSNLSNQVTLSGAGANVAFHTTIQFSVAPGEAGAWDFRFGIDYGLGGAAFLDGTLMDFRNTDMWWDGSFADPNQLLSGGRVLAAGIHTFELFGLEACCDGLTTAQYRVPGGAFTTFSTVPEPGALSLTLLGLAVTACYGRMRSRAR